MKANSLVRVLTAFCCLNFLALFCTLARAADKDEALWSGFDASSSSSRPPLPPESSNDAAVETDRYLYRPFFVPVVTESTPTEQQRYSAFLRLGHRLSEHGRDGRTLLMSSPPADARLNHLTLLRIHLQFIKDQKRALFLDIAPDRHGRILALPYPEETDQALGRKSWVILEAYPARLNEPHRLGWYAYVSHQEPHAEDLATRLFQSSDAKSLRHFLTHPI